MARFHFCEIVISSNGTFDSTSAGEFYLTFPLLLLRVNRELQLVYSDLLVLLEVLGHLDCHPAVLFLSLPDGGNESVETCFGASGCMQFRVTQTNYRAYQQARLPGGHRIFSTVNLTSLLSEASFTSRLASRTRNSMSSFSSACRCLTSYVAVESHHRNLPLAVYR